MLSKHAKLRDAQKRILKAFSNNPGTFALAGGTALELYYLHHRFSADLDFFSAVYDPAEIDGIVSNLKLQVKGRIKLESEFQVRDYARVRFYSVSLKGVGRSLKIDFVEDLLFKKPLIKEFDKVPVYNVNNIYLQKLTAITGGKIERDTIGREMARGRMEARDAFDIYMLSKKAEPLYGFLKKTPAFVQRGMVHWYRTFPRQDIKLGLLDLDIYDKNFDAREMITYLEEQIKKFAKGVVE